MDPATPKLTLEEFLKTPIGLAVPAVTRLIASKLESGDAPECIARALAISVELVNQHIKVIRRFPCRALDEKLEEEQREEDLERFAVTSTGPVLQRQEVERAELELTRGLRAEMAEKERRERELVAAVRRGDNAMIDRLLPARPSSGDVLSRALSLQPHHENEGPEYDGPTRSRRAKGNRSIFNLGKQRPSTAPDIVDDVARRAVLSDFLNSPASRGMRKKELKGIRLYCENNSPESVAEALSVHRTTVNRWLLKAERLAKGLCVQ